MPSSPRRGIRSAIKSLTMRLYVNGYISPVTVIRLFKIFNLKAE